MGWSSLGTQFCLELTFGVLFALAFVPRAPVGRLFYMTMGIAALVPLLVATLAPPLSGATAWTAPSVIASGSSLLAFPIIAGPFRGPRWGTALAWSMLSCGIALLFVLRDASRLSGWEFALGGASVIATGCVAGSVGLAMVLGHWYLTIPTLQIRYLRRLNRLTVASMGASLIIVLVSFVVFRGQLDPADSESSDLWALFCLGTRITAGLLLPLLFAWMTRESLKFDNTRSATGILYASTILVLIGTAVSISLQDKYGIPF